MAHHMVFDLPDEQYQALITLADQQGISPEMLAERWLSERQERELINRINVPLAEAVQQRYRFLISQRQKGVLTAEEHAEMLALIDQVEAFDARRVELLIALAQLQHKPFDTVVAELGIGTHTHE